jgi:hypothetical protein
MMRLFTLPEAGRLLRFSPRSMRRLIAAEALRAIEMPGPSGGRPAYRITEQELLRYCPALADGKEMAPRDSQ